MRRPTRRQIAAWDDMRAHVRALERLELIGFARADERRRWVAAAPLGQVAIGDEPAIAAYLGARLGAPVAAADVRCRPGAHPGILVIEQRIIDPLGAPIVGADDAVDRARTVHAGTVIGRADDGTDAILRWQGGHTLVVGSTGSGKSTLLRYVAASLAWCSDVDVIVCETGKRGEDYGGLALTQLVTTPDELADTMSRLRAEADRRAGLPTHQRRPIVVIVDEFAVARDDLADALKLPRSKADQTWQRAFSLWRSAGISMVIGAQRGTNEFIPGAPRSQAMQRVCMRIGSPVEWGYMAADSGLPSRHRWSPADFPEHAGMLALQPMGSSQWLRCRMWHLPDGAATTYRQPVGSGVGAGGRALRPDPVEPQVTAGPTAASDLADRVAAVLDDTPQGKARIADQVGRGATTVLAVLRSLAADGRAVQTPAGWIRPQQQEHP
jgi:hypothetical protein